MFLVWLTFLSSQLIAPALVFAQASTDKATDSQIAEAADPTKGATPAETETKVEAEEEPAKEPPSRFAVDIKTDSKADKWFADALEDLVAMHVSGSERVVTLPRSAFACRPCSISDYARSGIDIVFMGTLVDGRIKYQIHELWTPMLVSSGGFSVKQGVPTSWLKRDILRAFTPILSKGGVLDNKPFLTGTVLGPTVPTLFGSIASTPRGWSAIFGTVFLLFATAALLLVANLSDRRGHELKEMRGWIPSIAITVFSGIVAIVCLAITPSPAAAEAARLESWVWLVELIGGAAWASVILLALPGVFPALKGFDRIGHRDVLRISAAWFFVVVERIIAKAVMYSPFALLFFLALWYIKLPSRLAFLVLAPLWLLIARYWYRVVVEALSLTIDAELVEGKVSRQNPWHERVLEYVKAYCLRAGLDLPSSTFSKILFLPGSTPGIRTYGGGITETRIVIGANLLEFAMRGPHQVVDTEHIFSWTDWNQGFCVPTSIKQGSESDDKPQLRAELKAQVGKMANQARAAIEGIGGKRRTRRATARARGVKQGIGQIATLLGQVMPSKDALLPLVADSPRDMAVIRELLAEHYDFARLDPNSTIDDGDPSDRDFLFGPLLVEIGRIGRAEDRLLTFPSALSVMKSVPGGWYRSLEVLYKRWFMRSSAILADAYSALNFGRHHLVQYLYCFSERDDSLLTVRASRADLKALSRHITEAVSIQPPRTEEMGASLHNRLVWISMFSRKQLKEHRAFVVRNISYALLAGLSLGVFLSAVLYSMDYHPKYLKTQEDEQQAILDASMLPSDGKPERAKTKKPGTQPQKKEAPGDAKKN